MEGEVKFPDDDWPIGNQAFFDIYRQPSPGHRSVMKQPLLLERRSDDSTPTLLGQPRATVIPDGQKPSVPARVEHCDIYRDIP